VKNVRCIIVDDEPLARKILREYIDDVEKLELSGEFETAVDAFNFLGRETIDLMFLDVQMPRMTGIEFLQTAKRVVPVILTTAYPNYALQSYDLDVLDYLLKPIGFDRFLNAVGKATRYLKTKNVLSQLREVEADSFFVKCDRRIEQIRFDEVLYIEAMANYIVIHTTRGKFITYLTFKGIKEKLPERLFVKIHKSYLVAIGAVNSVADDEVIVGNIRLPIGKTHKVAFLNRISPIFFRR
jgi:DNA-binding LytR/AlgR family response regulator